VETRERFRPGLRARLRAARRCDAGNEEDRDCWFVLRRKRYLAALRPQGRLMVLTPCSTRNEICRRSGWNRQSRRTWRKNEREMAALLINTLSGPFGARALSRSVPPAAQRANRRPAGSARQRGSSAGGRRGAGPDVGAARQRGASTSDGQEPRQAAAKRKRKSADAPAQRSVTVAL